MSEQTTFLFKYKYPLVFRGIICFYLCLYIKGRGMLSPNRKIIQAMDSVFSVQKSLG